MAITEAPTGPLALPRAATAAPSTGRSASSPGPRPAPAGAAGSPPSTTRRSASCTAPPRCSSSCIGGLEALLIRVQLATPDGKIAHRRPVQPGLHDARRDDGLPRRHADRRRVRELPDAAADRRPRRRLPAAQRVQLLVLPRSAACSSTRRGSSAAAPDGGWFAYAPEHQPDLLAEPRHGLLRARPADHRHRLARRRDQPDRHRAQHAGAGHDAVQDAGVHVDGAGHAVPAAVRHPGHHRGAVPADVRPAVRRQLLQRRRRAPTRCCGSTCSGSSATPRCTS